MVYTICIGSNEHRKDNLALARKRLSELFPDIRFSAEADTKPLFFRRQALFTNQVARFISDYDADEVILRLKNIELSYTFENKAGRFFANKCKLFVRGTNLLTFSKIKDLDPERLNAGITNYPAYMTVTGGLSVSF